MVQVRAEIPASVWQVNVSVGDRVTAGQELVILESMKMEIPVETPVAGVVMGLFVEPGGSVQGGQVVAEVGEDA
jgi:biotin carboxyl carrier protein